MHSWWALTIALILNAMANVLMKIGANRGGQLAAESNLTAKLADFLNWPTLLAIFCFAANVLVYRRALQDLNVSVAYPVMVAGGLVLVTVAATSLSTLDERIGAAQIAGMVLIAFGVWLVVAKG